LSTILTLPHNFVENEQNNKISSLTLNLNTISKPHKSNFCTFNMFYSLLHNCISFVLFYSCILIYFTMGNSAFSQPVAPQVPPPQPGEPGITRPLLPENPLLGQPGFTRSESTLTMTLRDPDTTSRRICSRSNQRRSWNCYSSHSWTRRTCTWTWSSCSTSEPHSSSICSD
jgi:hypothetical protein